MTLVLSESEVLGFLTMKEAVASLERCFDELGAQRAVNSPRTRSIARPAVLHAMHASLPYLGRAGAKVYLGTKEKATFVFLLFDVMNGDLLAVMGADFLGRYRTGAASAVATRHLSGLRSLRLGIAGAGAQAVTQVMGLCEVAQVERVSVYSRSAGRRDAFCARLGRELGLDCKPAESVKEAFRGNDVATTVTSSRDAFVSAGDIEDVLHLNACGSNWAERRELEGGAVKAFSTVCVDDLRQSMVEAGDLILAAQEGAFSWKDAVELKDIVHSKLETRPKTLFKSNGVAAEDVALASVVYDKALASGASAPVRVSISDLA